MPQVFVYGTLKAGYRNHGWLSEGKAIPHGTTTLTFKARMICVGFPVILRDKGKVKIEGELYTVDRKTFRNLDRLESNGRMYQRKRKRLADGRYTWVYIGVSRFWEHHTRPNDNPTTQPGADGVIRWSRA